VSGNSGTQVIAELSQKKYFKVDGRSGKLVNRGSPQYNAINLFGNVGILTNGLLLHIRFVML
jgi:hypothetical protein